MMCKKIRWIFLAGILMVSFYLPGTVQAMAFTGIEDAAFLSGEEQTEVTTVDGREVRFMNIACVDSGIAHNPPLGTRCPVRGRDH